MQPVTLGAGPGCWLSPAFPQDSGSYGDSTPLRGRRGRESHFHFISQSATSLAHRGQRGKKSTTEPAQLGLERRIPGVWGGRQGQGHLLPSHRPCRGPLLLGPELPTPLIAGGTRGSLPSCPTPKGSEVLHLHPSPSRSGRTSPELLPGILPLIYLQDQL